jgi:hypothetical protein
MRVTTIQRTWLKEQWRGSIEPLAAAMAAQ